MSSKPAQGNTTTAAKP